ncbi:hypothetical protein ES703_06870 [subsurface metagenome]
MEDARESLELKIDEEGNGYRLAVTGGAVGTEKHCPNPLMLIKDIISVLLHWQTGL